MGVLHYIDTDLILIGDHDKLLFGSSRNNVAVVSAYNVVILL